jgi:hypothetical protein
VIQVRERATACSLSANSSNRLAVSRQRSGGNAAAGEFEAASRLIGDNPEMRFWHAIALLASGKIDQGIALLREVAPGDPNWITLALRLPAVILPPNLAMIEQIRALL